MIIKKQALDVKSLSCRGILLKDNKFLSNFGCMSTFGTVIISCKGSYYGKHSNIYSLEKNQEKVSYSLKNATKMFQYETLEERILANIQNAILHSTITGQ